MKLADFQAEFTAAIRYQNDGSGCGIHSDAFTSEQRLQIYRNNFVVGLVEILQITYPMVEALVGEECFSALARHHVLHHPPVHGDVSDYGEGFCETLTLFDQVLEQAPYLPEVARFEWFLDLARQQQQHVALAVDLKPLHQLSEVTSQEQAQLVFHVKPGVLAFESCHAVFDLKKAIESQQFDDLTLDQPQFGIIDASAPDIIVTQPYPESVTQLLHQMLQKHPLGTIPSEQLMSLNTVIQSGVIAGYSLSPYRPTIPQGDHHE